MDTKDEAIAELMKVTLRLAEEVNATRDLLYGVITVLQPYQSDALRQLAQMLEDVVTSNTLQATEPFVAQARDVLPALRGESAAPIASVQRREDRPSDPTTARASFRLVPGGLADDA